MRNYALDTKMLPKVWVTWASTKDGRFNKRYWLNCQTGKKKDKPESWMIYTSEGDVTTYGWRGEHNFGITYYTQHNDNIWIASNSKPRYAYAKYHKDIDRLEIAVVGINTSRKEEKRTWEFISNRFFIGKDKTIIDQFGLPISYSVNVYDYHTAWSPKELLSMILRLNPSKYFVDEFKKFIGGNSFTIGNGTSVDVEYSYHLQRWYETSQKVRGKGKQQKLTDMLTALPLMDSSDFAEKYPVREEPTGNWYGELINFVHFERVNNEWCVLRAFHRDKDGNIDERWRMYVGDNGTNRIVAPSKEGWVPSKQTHTKYNRFFFANADEATDKCNRIKYVLNAMGDVERREEVDFLITTLRFPEIEQLIKLGYPQAAHSIINSNTPKADLRHIFGGYFNEKEKNILRKVGLTKAQLDYYMPKTGLRVASALEAMRKMFGNDLSYLDINSFEKYYDGHLRICETFWRGLGPAIMGLNLDEMRFFKNLVRLGEKRENVFHIAHDTLNSYRALTIGTEPEIDWYFADYSDLIRAHDAVIELKRIQDEERRAMWDMKAAERRKKEEEKRIKVDKERKQYEYEDDNYIIRLPKDSNEIVREGSSQHICISGYTGRHAFGETNLFFLREKSESDAPFYAIEMDNNKSIVQIHGFGNKWLGNDPEAIPTVVRWLRKHGIHCDETILTCKAKGYSSCNDYVPMPVVD